VPKILRDFNRNVYQGPILQNSISANFTKLQFGRFYKIPFRTILQNSYSAVLPYNLEGFDLTTRNSKARDNTTRPRHRGNNPRTLSMIVWRKIFVDNFMDEILALNSRF
jgi:hypothetical protein